VYYINAHLGRAATTPLKIKHTAGKSIKSAFLLKQGQFVLKFRVEGVVPANHSSCQKNERIFYRV